MVAFEETAFAKVNLALHVRRRRSDGYHELETLFAFAEDGDCLTVEVSQADRLTISGEFADGLSSGAENLVLRALELLRTVDADIPPLAIYLEKRLPVAAGIGGGSADAAGLIRLVGRHFLKDVDREKLASISFQLGADVPACITSETQLGFGVGEDLHAVASSNIAGRPILLVNPRQMLATGPVFAAWDGVDNGALPGGSALNIAQNGRNDLEKPAVELVPVIGEVLGILSHQKGVLLCRMSGSGATCFALFDSMDACDEAVRWIAEKKPEWWTLASKLR